MRRRGMLLVLLLLIPAAARAQRLPADVVPEHYDLAVTPNLPAATFTGKARITVRLTKPSTSIVLNAAEIAFDSVTVRAAVHLPT